MTPYNGTGEKQPYPSTKLRQTKPTRSHNSASKNHLTKYRVKIKMSYIRPGYTELVKTKPNQLRQVKVQIFRFLVFGKLFERLF